MSTLFSWVVALAVLLALAGLGLFALIGIGTARKSSQLSERLEGGLGGTPSVGSQSSGGVLGRLAMRATTQGGVLERSVRGDSEFSRMVRQAGYRNARAPANFQALRVLASLVGVLVPVVYWLVVKPPWPHYTVFLLAFVGFALGYLVSTFVVRNMAENRQQALRCEVRLFVQLLTMIMDVGLSTRQTLATIAREAPAVMPNLAEELGVVLRQIESGGDESEALRMLSQELDVPELTSILNILRQVERFGGGIREPLLETLERIEEQNKFRLQELVGKISGRMTLVMVAFFIPALLAFTAGPGFMAIIRALKNFR